MRSIRPFLKFLVRWLSLASDFCQIAGMCMTQDRANASLGTGIRAEQTGWNECDCRFGEVVVRMLCRITISCQSRKSWVSVVLSWSVWQKVAVGGISDKFLDGASRFKLLNG